VKRARGLRRLVARQRARVAAQDHQDSLLSPPASGPHARAQRRSRFDGLNSRGVLRSIGRLTTWQKVLLEELALDGPRLLRDRHERPSAAALLRRGLVVCDGERWRLSRDGWRVVEALRQVVLAAEIEGLEDAEAASLERELDHLAASDPAVAAAQAALEAACPACHGEGELSTRCPVCGGRR
jgi:hypothetical protein